MDFPSEEHRHHNLYLIETWLAEVTQTDRRVQPLKHKMERLAHDGQHSHAVTPDGSTSEEEQKPVLSCFSSDTAGV